MVHKAAPRVTRKPTPSHFLTKPEGVKAPPPPAEPVAEEGLALAARTIFTSGDYGKFTLRNGNILEIKMAKTRQIGELTAFFKSVAGAIPDTDFGKLLAIVAEAQTRALKVSGSTGNLDPRQISLDILATTALGIKPGEDVDVEQVVKNGMNVSSILIGIVGAILAEVAVFASCFTNLSKEEFLDLDIDEGALALAAVFMGNYSFFSQTLPPIFKGLVGAWAAKRTAHRQAG